MNDSKVDKYKIFLKEKAKPLSTDELKSMSKEELVEHVSAIQTSQEEDHKVFHAILEGSMAGYWDWYLKEDFEYMSPTFKAMFGFEDSEVPNDPSWWQKQIHPDDLPGVFQLYDKHVESKGKVPFDNEVRYRHKDGSIVWVYCRGKVIEWDESGQPVRMIGTHVDITSLKTLHHKLEHLVRSATVQEKALDKAEEAAEKAQEAVGKSEAILDVTDLADQLEESMLHLQDAKKEMDFFTYAVSHDLRAPLRAIEGFSRVLADKAKEKLSEEEQRYLRIIGDNVVKMSQLIDHILQLSRLGRTELRKYEFDTEETVDEVLDILRAGAPNTLQVEVKRPLPNLYGDRTMLTMALQNVIGNAIKFSSKKEKPMVVISAEEKDGFTTVKVQDNGAGFDMKYVDKIFLVFQRLHTSEEFDGTGVGMALVKRAIIRHNGTITANSEAGKGTVIELSIPSAT